MGLTVVGLLASEMPLRGKQRELYERDERVLTLAQRIFMNEGYHAVTIENIARELGLAHGTLYQRFSCKEVLILELAIRYRKQVTDLMGFASRIPGRLRDSVGNCQRGGNGGRPGASSRRNGRVDLPGAVGNDLRLS